MSAKHTPGPWVMTGDPRERVVIRGAGMEYVATIEPDHVTEDLKEVVSKSGQANARLIAEAPCLLTLLDKAERLIDFGLAGVAGKRLAADIRAAIAKARGGK